MAAHHACRPRDRGRPRDPALAALAIAVFLQLECPYWAAMTALIVIQPTRGLLLEKILPVLEDLSITLRTAREPHLEACKPPVQAALAALRDAQVFPPRILFVGREERTQVPEIQGI